MDEIKKTMSEILSDEFYEVAVDRKANTLVIRDIEMDVMVSGRCNIKNRHFGKIASMVASARKLEIDDINKKTGVWLDDYREDKDANLYVQLTYVDEWNLETPLNKDTIMDADVAGNALRKFAYAFLRVNGVIKDKEVEGKN